uniref:Methyltransferase small domain-containing protein n=1 Tax=Tetradesmus obliquus TaxID=3088 RepID=A0A383VAG9_TETOB
MASPPDEPVLSEVHMESCPPHVTSWSTRFCYSLPQQQQFDRTQLSSITVPAEAAAAAPADQQTGAGAKPSAEQLANGTASSCVEVDADGDLLLLSRPARRSQHISIQHSLATPVSRCGEQVWLGSCLLCDWLIHNAQQLAGCTLLEFGAGVGLTSILAAHFAQRVLLTDTDAGALELAAGNVAANGVQERVSVRRLDWLQLFDTQLGRCSDDEVLSLLNSASSSSSRVSRACSSAAMHCADAADEAAAASCQEQQQQVNGSSSSSSSYAWLPSDLQQLCAVDVWLAADVVYNETLTDAFMRTAHQLMTWQQQQQQQQAHTQQELLHSSAPRHAAGSSSSSSSRHGGKGSCSVRSPVLLVAVEKRFNFTYRDLDARASTFEHFMTYVVPAPEAAAAATATAAAAATSGSKPLFSGRRLAVSDLPQAMEYDRSADLELWELLPLL